MEGSRGETWNGLPTEMVLFAGRLVYSAMVAMLGIFVQANVTHAGPIYRQSHRTIIQPPSQALHLENNLLRLLTNFKVHQDFFICTLEFTIYIFLFSYRT